MTVTGPSPRQGTSRFIGRHVVISTTDHSWKLAFTAAVTCDIILRKITVSGNDVTLSGASLIWRSGAVESLTLSEGTVSLECDQAVNPGGAVCSVAR